MHTSAFTALKAPNPREKGMALIVVLLLVTIFTVLGSTAMLATSTDLQISSNHRMSEQALYAAEAGAEYAHAETRRLGRSAVDPDLRPAETALAGGLGDRFLEVGLGLALGYAIALLAR